MEQAKFFKYGFVGLLLLNAVLIAYLIVSKPKRPHPPAVSGGDFKQEVINILQLDQSQIDSFEQLAEAHNDMMKRCEQDQKELLLPFFFQLTKESPDPSHMIALDKIEMLERKKMEATYEHFEELKNILTREQRPHFKEVISRFVDHILLSNKKTPPPPKEMR